MVKVGYYAPLPPAPTGVADYAEALLDGLRGYGRTYIAPDNCETALYHLGNNSLHAEIYRRALDRPGVAVLHDGVLHHFLLGFLGEREYVEEFVYNYGEWSRGLARDLWRGRAASGADSRYFEFPMLRRIAERSRAVVVHTPAAADRVKRHAPAARVVEIPLLFTMPRGAAGYPEALRYRQRLGLEPGTFLFAVFGYLRESKRLIPVLEAFREVHREVPATALLVAGRFASSDLARASAPLMDAPGVVRLPFLSESEFWLAAAASDACINLRYPAAGETSGIAIRLMGIGKPVMLTDSREYARFPEGACIRIPGGVSERDSLRRHMILVTSITEVASAIGLRGAGHIREHHRVETVSKQFWDLLCEFCT